MLEAHGSLAGVLWPEWDRSVKSARTNAMVVMTCQQRGDA
jgi:hypothetical protein